jgi:nitrile hydratase subunit alpha
VLERGGVTGGHPRNDIDTREILRVYCFWRGFYAPETSRCSCLTWEGNPMVTSRRDLLTAALTAVGAVAVPDLTNAQDHDHDHNHNHNHDHDHQAVPSDPALRVKALESLMVAKGLVDRATLDALIDNYEHKVGPRNGARVIARAWVDHAFKQRLLADGTAAIAELGYGGDTMLVVENTAKIHNLVVCTLCSCYPWSTLGLPPVWYKSTAYRSRSVIDPRGVLREFGLELGDDVEVRVWDSTADLRYLVLPERPAGTEGMSEAELAALVTRDAMLGVAKVKSPHEGTHA